MIEFTFQKLAPAARGRKGVGVGGRGPEQEVTPGPGRGESQEEVVMAPVALGGEGERARPAGIWVPAAEKPACRVRRLPL